MTSQAEVAELADALGSGPSGLTMPVEVQVLSSALQQKDLRQIDVSPFAFRDVRCFANFPPP